MKNLEISQIYTTERVGVSQYLRFSHSVHIPDLFNQSHFAKTQRRENDFKKLRGSDCEVFLPENHAVIEHHQKLVFVNYLWLPRHPAHQ